MISNTIFYHHILYYSIEIIRSRLTLIIISIAVHLGLIFPCFFMTTDFDHHDFFLMIFMFY